MKSLLISGVFPPIVGGSGRWFWEIYSRLNHADYVIAAGEHPAAAEFDRTHTLDVRRVPLAFPDLGYFALSGYLRYRRLAAQVGKLVRSERVGAIHCGALLPDAWIGRLLAKRFRLPLLVYMHGEETCYANASRQLDWMGRRILRDATVVVANSRNTARILREHWRTDEGRIRVLTPGVDCEKFVPAWRDAAVRARLGWGDRPVILTVGRLQERKGQDMLIRALPAIREQIPNVLYAIVGDGGDAARLEGLSQELGVTEQVRFHRDLGDADLVRCYQQCDLFALPNRRVGDDIEGFGMVLLEAQACGRPVLAGNSGGTVETLRAGETGVVADCTSPETVAAEIFPLLRDESRRTAMGAAGREWVTGRFDWPVLADRARELHEDVISRSRAAELVR